MTLSDGVLMMAVIGTGVRHDEREMRRGRFGRGRRGIVGRSGRELE